MQFAPVTELETLNGTKTEFQTKPTPWRYSSRGIVVRLFLTCWLVYTAHFATNTVREIYPALSLGDHLTFDVSEYLGLHPDIFELPGRGVFINNNPGASILGAIPYTLFRPIIDQVVEQVQRTRALSSESAPEYKSSYPMAREFYRQAYQRGFDIKFGLAAGVIQAFLMAPLSALSVVVMFRILISLTASMKAALLLALLYAFATPVFYRTAQLNHNLLVGHSALFAFALLWQPWAGPGRPKYLHYLLAGLLCGWAVVLDYTGLMVVAVLSLYTLAQWVRRPSAQKSWGDLLLFGVGVAMSLAVLLGYQWLAFGHPLYPAQRYMPPTPFSHYGYNGMAWPHPDLLWETAFGIRFGLFTSAPLLLLALYVPAWFHRRNRLVGNLEMGCIIVFTVALFLFAAASQYGWLQFNSGVRYVVPVTPFLFLLVVDVLLRMPVGLAVFIGFVTTYWSWCLAMYRDVEQGLGVFESLIHITLEGVRLPWLTTLEGMGYVKEGTFALPLLLLCGVILWVLWAVNVPKMQTARFFSLKERSNP